MGVSIERQLQPEVVTPIAAVTITSAADVWKLVVREGGNIDMFRIGGSDKAVGGGVFYDNDVLAFAKAIIEMHEGSK
jgi:hypothetical protein